MTASLPQEVREVFERFITCEFTTVDSRQQPIVWPVTPYYSPGAPTIDATTGLGYPKKADDARRNPRVAMLFSDPTGSGIDSGIQVLVQGTAEVDDRDLEANRERYWRESAVKLPRRRDVHAAALPATACSAGTSTASTSRCARSASSSGRTATSRSRPNATTRTWRRSAPATARSP